jgi:ABC-type ATPase involved in cell division
LLSSSPSSLLIVVGPSGSGKSNIIKQVLRERKMTLYVDFKRDPIMNGEEVRIIILVKYKRANQKINN